jgi:hypothetical protein
LITVYTQQRLNRLKKESHIANGQQPLEVFSHVCDHEQQLSILVFEASQQFFKPISVLPFL